MESRNTSCRLTTRCTEATQSSGEIGPRTLMTQQIWFDTSAAETAEVSHNSRCEKVSGWRRAWPLSSHCLKRARLSSDMGSCLEHRIFTVAEEPVNLFTRKGVEIDFNINRGGGGFRYRYWGGGRRRRSRRGAANVSCNQRCNLANRAGAHQACWRKGDADGRFERVLN